MAHGAPDYWDTYNYLIGNVLSLLGETLSEGGAVYTILDAIDGKLDDAVDLTTLETDVAAALAAMLGVEGNLEDGSDLINKLDALDGTMDGRLTLSQLNTSSVKTNLDTTISKLADTVSALASVVSELEGVHSDTSDMVAYGEEDWGGTAGDGDVDTLLASANSRRNMLKLTNNGASVITYARSAGGPKIGDIPAGNSAIFYDSPGVWLGNGAVSFSAHEEWAT